KMEPLSCGKLAGGGRPALQPLAQKPHQPRCQESGLAPWFVDGVVHPEMRRAGHHAGAHEEARLLERQQERLEVQAWRHEVVLGTRDEEYAELVVGEGG